jgi:radical SAM protein with 4Fe4S-binding SPASM domain
VFDRAGYVNNVVSNENYMKERMQGKKVVGCDNSLDRTSEWLHINSAGKVFLCCNDYNFEYEFGDINLNSIADIWRSDRHIEVIEKAFNGICTKCLSAVLEDNRIQRGAVATNEMRFSRK